MAISVSRRRHRRGRGLTRALSAVLVLLIVLVMYFAWQNSIPFTDLPFLLLLAPLWFYVIAFVLGGAAIAASLRGRRPRSRAYANEPMVFRDSYYTPPQDSLPEPVIDVSPPPRRDRVVYDFVPVVKTPPKEEAEAGSAGVSFMDHPRVGEPTLTREAEPTPAPAVVVVDRAKPEPAKPAKPAKAPPPAKGAPPAKGTGRPETLISRLLNWLDETSPDSSAKRNRTKGSTPSGKRKR